MYLITRVRYKDCDGVLKTEHWAKKVKDIEPFRKKYERKGYTHVCLNYEIE